MELKDIKNYDVIPELDIWQYCQFLKLLTGHEYSSRTRCKDNKENFTIEVKCGEIHGEIADFFEYDELVDWLRFKLTFILNQGGN